MTAAPTTIRLFRFALHLWMLGFLLSVLPVLDVLYIEPLSPRWVPPGPFARITHTIGAASMAMASPVMVAVGIVLALVGLFRRSGVIAALVLWWVQINLMGQAWLAGSGGQQLMAVVLFWNIGLSVAEGSPGSWRNGLRTLSFWMIRSQLVLAYAVTAVHKLTGVLWPSGDAIGVVLTDEAFAPSLVANWPVLCHLVTWAVLVLQCTIPFALWWRRTRVAWLLAAMAFHLATAIWLDIPEMGFAFCVVLLIQLSEAEGQWIMNRLGQARGAPSLP